MTRAKIVVIVLALAALLLPAALPWLKTPLILGTAFGIAAPMKAPTGCPTPPRMATNTISPERTQ